METLYFIVVLLLLVVAWYLGRRSGKKHHSTSTHVRTGIDLSIDEQPDEALESFISSVEVNADTLDTHFAIGRLMRQRGEVERAIKVHQNLLSRTVLTEQQLKQAQLELARDYLKAGLLDRAERLLLEFVETKSYLCHEAARHLIELYQDEHEWAKAIRAASHSRDGFFSSTNDEVSGQLCQFCCELASEAILKQDLDEAETQLKQARKFRTDSVRVSMLSGQLAEKRRNYEAAIGHYRKIPEQDAAMLPEALEPLQRCFGMMKQESDLAVLLQGWLVRYRDPRILSYIARIGPQVTPQVDARGLIADYLEQQPSAIGIRALLDGDGEQSEAGCLDSHRALEQIDIIRCTIDKLIDEAPGYHCDKCGFSGNQHHWLCPQCRQWDTVKPARAF